MCNLLFLQELLDLHQSGLTHQNSITSKPTPLKWIQSPGTHRALRSSADAAKQALLENAVKNPQSAQARQLIAAVYGVTNPSASLARPGLERDMLAAAAALQTGLCSQHGMLLNRCAGPDCFASLHIATCQYQHPELTGIQTRKRQLSRPMMSGTTA